MNIVDLVLFIVVAVVAIASARKGFLMTLFNIAAYAISAVASKIFSLPVAEYAYANFFSEKVLSKLYEMMPSGSVEGEINTVFSGVIESLPEYMQTLIAHFFSAEIVPGIAAEESAALTVEAIEQSYLAPVITNVLSIIAMVLLFILVVFVLKIVFSAVNKGLTRKKHKIIRGTNTLLGAAFGAVKGTFIAAVLAAVLNVGVPVVNTPVLIDYVNGSAICNMVAEILK